jgi:hypothetical protein
VIGVPHIYEYILRKIFGLNRQYKLVFSLIYIFSFLSLMNTIRTTLKVNLTSTVNIGSYMSVLQIQLFMMKRVKIIICIFNWKLIPIWKTINSFKLHIF